LKNIPEKESIREFLVLESPRGFYGNVAVMKRDVEEILNWKNLKLTVL